MASSTDLVDRFQDVSLACIKCSSRLDELGTLQTLTQLQLHLQGGFSFLEECHHTGPLWQSLHLRSMGLHHVDQNGSETVRPYFSQPGRSVFVVGTRRLTLQDLQVLSGLEWLQRIELAWIWRTNVRTGAVSVC